MRIESSDHDRATSVIKDIGEEAGQRFFGLGARQRALGAHQALLRDEQDKSLARFEALLHGRSHPGLPLAGLFLASA